ncbi:MFS transporter [Neorhizobium alkalisoli]|uniref:MFS transporter n=1 Tax=Neorhizobium alkalisoli TaxID=528178 RepID=A0A561R1P1_9HYPH|nr:MFS transporter [Neorhizobium alkalisoli]TWF56483.1 MFS transporter [Neorhizobium alkalisoli]
MSQALPHMPPFNQLSQKPANVTTFNLTPLPFLMPIPSPTVRAVAALSLTQLIGWGASFWLPAVTGPAMARDLGMTLPMVMAGPTVMLVVMAIASWPLGGVFERFGARPVMVIGSLFGAAGLFVMGVSAGPDLYFLAWLILGLAGATMLTTPAQIAVTEIAGDKARQALSVLILAGGLTSTIVWPLTGVLQAEWGWRAPTLLYAALILFLCLPLHWAVLARKPREKSAAKTTAEPVVIDRPRFALLAITFAANGFFTWGFALTIIILFEAAGLDHASALTAAAFIGIAQWGGRMVDFLGGRRV